MIINIVDAMLSVVLVWILMPQYGIIGYIITVYFTELINATLSITKLLCVTKIKFKIFDWLFKPIIAIIASTALVRFLLYKIGAFAQTRLDIVIHISAIACIYTLTLILVRALKIKRIKRSIINFFKA
jgi:hypothetical protein